MVMSSLFASLISSSLINGTSAVSDRLQNLAHHIRAFVEHPLTNLVKGVILMTIGLVDASHTFREDIAHQQVRVGHGLVIIGFFSVLGALPHLLEGLDASARYLELRERERDEPESNGSSNSMSLDA